MHLCKCWLRPDTIIKLKIAVNIDVFLLLFPEQLIINDIPRSNSLKNSFQFKLFLVGMPEGKNLQMKAADKMTNIVIIKYNDK